MSDNASEFRATVFGQAVAELGAPPQLHPRRPTTNQRLCRTGPADHPGRVLEASLRPLPDPQTDRPPPRPRALPALLQHRTRPHRPLDPRPHPRGSPREGQAVAQEALMRRHNSETGHPRPRQSQPGPGRQQRPPGPPASHRPRSADHPRAGAGLRPAESRLRRPRRLPQPPRPPSLPRPRSRPLARHPRRRRQQPREQLQPGHVAGRPGLPSRRRHPHRPSPAGPEPTWSSTARPRTLTHPHTSTKEP
jgi:hypothetical protein